MKGFDTSGPLPARPSLVADLGKNEVYVSRETAEGLGVGVEDSVEASLVRPTARVSVNETRPGQQGPPGS